MRLLNNKKGLATGIFVIMVVMFTAALMTIVAKVGTNQFYEQIDNISNETISQDVKDTIRANTTFVLWGDKVFVMLFITLLIAYLVSSFTLPAQRPIFLLLFFGIMIIVTVISMALSNSWTYMLQEPLMAEAVKDLKFTDHFMRNFPIITFIIGIMGAVIFYGRREVSFTSGGSDNSGIE